ncbi:tyrosine-type recombinase/integrase [Rhodococcus sp. NPDC127530]|uniref:tyrosine-type recombinase/integrase n=1 Tax=unclassified Rhodococcus (in: high G+C Gram-positive bacteria) TaxID=192944 RepID=UPI003636EB4B
MTSHDRLTVEEVLAAFDEHLRRTRGVCAGTRCNYARHVGEFLVAVFGDRGVEFAEVRAPEVAAFVGGLSGRYRPRTVELVATALRVFFRFLRAQGWCEDRLVDAVPMVPHRPSGLVRHLDPRVLEQLIASLATASPRDLRDRAIILTIARLGLRPGEVARLRLTIWTGATPRFESAPARPVTVRCCR